MSKGWAEKVTILSSTIFIATLLLLFLPVLNNIFLEPILSMDIALAKICSEKFDKNGKLPEIAKIITSTGANDLLHKELSLTYSKKGDFANSANEITRISNSLLKKEAEAYLTAAKDELRFPETTIFQRTIIYLLKYLDSKTSDYLKLSIFYAKQLDYGEKYALTFITTREFEKRNMYVENLKYWENVDPISYPIAISNVEKYILNPDLPQYVRNKTNYFRIKYFIPIFEGYRSKKISSHDAEKKMDSLVKFYFDKKRGRFIAVSCIDSVCLFYNEIGKRKKAVKLLEEILADTNSDKMMGNEIFIKGKRRKAVKIYTAMKMDSEAYRVLFSEPSLNDRYKLMSIMLEEKGKIGLKEALDFYNYTSTLKFRLQLHFKYNKLING